MTAASPRSGLRCKIPKVGDRGLEVSSFSRGKPHSPVEAAQNPAHFPADLAKLIQNWGRLTGEDRRRITAIVEGLLA